MDQDEIPINIYFNLSKAFYTIDHLILTDKLNYYGINCTNLNLLNSYISNRKHYTEIYHIKSNILTITTGIPQGSILGPMLFIIYIRGRQPAARGPTAARRAISCGPRTDSEIMHGAARARNIDI